MRIAVTGANGFVGQAVVQYLAHNDHQVLAYTRRPKFLTGGAAITPMVAPELGTHADWRFRSGQNIDVLVHTAARVHVVREEAVDSLAEYYSANTAGTLALAQQAATAGVKRFVFISSVKVNGESTQLGRAFTEADAPNPQDAYGQSKYEAEQGLRQISADTNMEVVIIRPPLVYGPGVKANFAALMSAVQRGWPLPLGMVHNQRSLVALDNLVDFIVTCMTHPQAASQTFLVSDGQDLSTNVLVRGMAQAAGVPVRLLPVPVWALRAGASLLGKGDMVQRLCGNLQVNILKARSLLGWAPPVHVEEALRRTIVL